MSGGGSHLSARFVPLDRPAVLRTRRSKFANTFSKTLALSSARPEHPALVLSFDTREKGALSFPCSRYDRYEDNLRALALSLEALRAVDRYGVTQSAEQYRGWAQLPAGASEEMTRNQAAIWLASVSVMPKDYILGGEGAREEAYKIAARRLHPDLGGSHEEFVRLGNAMKVLRAGDYAP